MQFRYSAWSDAEAFLRIHVDHLTCYSASEVMENSFESPRPFGLYNIVLS